MIMFWKYGLKEKYIIKVNFTCFFFTFLNVATRKLTYMPCIGCSAVLDYLPKRYVVFHHNIPPFLLILTHNKTYSKFLHRFFSMIFLMRRLLHHPCRHI